MLPLQGLVFDAELVGTTRLRSEKRTASGRRDLLKFPGERS